MFIGLEYVLSAYGIWVCTFTIYIVLTKRRLKITNQAVVALEQKTSESNDNIYNEEE